MVGGDDGGQGLRRGHRLPVDRGDDIALGQSGTDGGRPGGRPTHRRSRRGRSGPAQAAETAEASETARTGAVSQEGATIDPEKSGGSMWTVVEALPCSICLAMAMAVLMGMA